ncbi:MAG: matrixin family metalloprotease [Flavobacteriales bacterium]|nr:matrixin family metalloprotease [Flavobacteriales bacterium]
MNQDIRWKQRFQNYSKIIGSLIFLVLFFLILEGCNTKKEKNIGIVSLGDFPQQYIDSIEHAIDKVYGFNSFVIANEKMPSEFYTNFKSPRYNASKIIGHLNKKTNDSVDIVLGLTSYDICVTKKNIDGSIKKPEYKYRDWGIFGLGYINKSGCVVSKFRLKSKDENLLLRRIQKVSIHEIGHNLGLPHCSDKKCVMTSAAEKLSTVDGVHLNLCSECRKTIL